MVEIDAQLAARGLRDALSGAVGDPSLELAFWLPHREKYVDIDGRPMTLPTEGALRRTTFVVGSDGPVAALVLDARAGPASSRVGRVARKRVEAGRDRRRRPAPSASDSESASRPHQGSR